MKFVLCCCIFFVLSEFREFNEFKEFREYSSSLLLSTLYLSTVFACNSLFLSVLNLKIPPRKIEEGI